MISELIGKTITLSRDCEACLIPHGTPIMLETGTEISITQALGGSYTGIVAGNMVRIEGHDGDALGLAVDHTVEDILQDPLLNVEQKAWALMRTCFDPEIPVNIVDLGLVYAANQLALGDTEAVRLHVVMTLTSAACGMGPILTEDVKQKISQITGVQDAIVELVFDPPWSQEMMSEAARLQLGLL